MKFQRIEYTYECARSHTSTPLSHPYSAATRHHNSVYMHDGDGDIRSYCYTKTVLVDVKFVCLSARLDLSIASLSVCIYQSVLLLAKSVRQKQSNPFALLFFAVLRVRSVDNNFIRLLWAQLANYFSVFRPFINSRAVSVRFELLAPCCALSTRYLPYQSNRFISIKNDWQLFFVPTSVYISRAIHTHRQARMKKKTTEEQRANVGRRAIADRGKKIERQKKSEISI